MYICTYVCSYEYIYVRSCVQSTNIYYRLTFKLNPHVVGKLYIYPAQVCMRVIYSLLYGLESLQVCY